MPEDICDVCQEQECVCGDDERREDWWEILLRDYGEVVG